MPLVKNTETGNHYLVKINTDGDACTRTAIRSYDKQDGSEGADGNTVFNLPFTYEPDSHTMWVYVNGQKAEYEPTMTGTVQLLQYNETDVFEVTFQVGLEDDDVIEFIVAGNYDGDVSSGSIGDLTDYLRRDGSNTFTGAVGGLDLTNNAQIINLVAGSSPSHGVNVSQLGDNSLHKHENLYNNVGIVVANTSADYLGMSSKQIKFLANGSVAADAVNLGQLDTKINIDGTLPFTGNQSMGNFILSSVADGVVSPSSKQAVNGSQLYESGIHLNTNEPLIEAQSYTIADGTQVIFDTTFNATNFSVPAGATGFIMRVRVECDKSAHDTQPIYIKAAVGVNAKTGVTGPTLAGGSKYWQADAQQNVSTFDCVVTNDVFVEAPDLTTVDIRINWVNLGSSAYASGFCKMWLIGYFI